MLHCYIVKDLRIGVTGGRNHGKIIQMVNVTDRNFEDEVLRSDLPVLIDFWAPWCGPCQMVGPIIEELAKEWEGKLRVVKVNVDENSALASQYKVMSIPALFLFKNGQVVKQWVGVRNKEELGREIEQVISNK